MVSPKILIWLFFVLISDQTVVSLATKFDLPIKPTYIYAVIAISLFAFGLSSTRSLRPFRQAAGFFVPLVLLTLLIVVTYRGEQTGPDFGVTILRPAFTPSAMSYAVWPALNLLACAGLFLLASKIEFRNAIITAAFFALVLQVCTMEADMWVWSLFGDANGRAGGLAQNANMAALLIVALAAICLRTRYAPVAVILAIFGAFISQSKTGLICSAVLTACWFFERKYRFSNRQMATLAGSAVVALAITVVFSPVLHPSAQAIAQFAEKEALKPKVNGILPPAELDAPVPLEERLQSRASVDESMKLRGEALSFYLGILKDHPFGMGTGFTNKFLTGPHNTFLKVAVENGIAGALILLTMLAWLSWRAITPWSFQLIALAITAWVAAMLYHTFLIDPIMLPALAVVLGMSSSPSCRKEHIVFSTKEGGRSS